MKKSDLKTGMIVVFADESECIIMKGTDQIYYDEVVSLSEGSSGGLFGSFEGITDDMYFNDVKIIKVFKKDSNRYPFRKGTLIWERKEEKPFLMLDGVEYSESKLRSLIKKATE